MPLGARFLDPTGFAYWALSDSLPGVTVSADFDSTDFTVPEVRFLASSDGQVHNGPGLWKVTLTVELVDTPARIGGLCERVYNTIHGWAGRTFPMCHVNSVGDMTVPSYAGDAPVSDKSLVQYAGSFLLTCRTI